MIRSWLLAAGIVGRREYGHLTTRPVVEVTALGDPFDNRRVWAGGFPAYGLSMIFWVWLAQATAPCPSIDASPSRKADRW